MVSRRLCMHQIAQSVIGCMPRDRDAMSLPIFSYYTIHVRLMASAQTHLLSPGTVDLISRFSSQARERQERYQLHSGPCSVMKCQEVRLNVIPLWVDSSRVKKFPYGRGTVLLSTTPPWSYTEIQAAPSRQLSEIAILDRVSCWGYRGYFLGYISAF